MDSLPLDVLCLVLEQCEVSMWLLRLRRVSRAWRRAVDRVAVKTLPLALGQHGCKETLASLTLPFVDKGESYAAVGCGVFQLSGGYVRLEREGLVGALCEREMPRCSGHGYALSLRFPDLSGTLLDFRDGGEVASTPVSVEAMRSVRGDKGGQSWTMAEDGTVWICHVASESGAAVLKVRRVDPRSGRVCEESCFPDRPSPGVTQCIQVVDGRYLNIAYAERGLGLLIASGHGDRERGPRGSARDSGGVGQAAA
jgi:hypothetical protein